MIGLEIGASAAVAEPGKAGQLLQQKRRDRPKIIKEGARRGELIGSIGCLLARGGSILSCANPIAQML